MGRTDLVFTTTAMARPEVVFRTYESFKNNLKEINLKDYPLFINIDPLPGLDDNNPAAQQVVEVGKLFFGHVTYRIAKEGSFPKAIKWLWGQCPPPTENKYTFHLEDDWEMLFPLSINTLYDRMVGCHQCCMRAYSRVRRTSHGYMISLSPSLLIREFCWHMSQRMNDRDNPEEQMRKICKNKKKRLPWSNNSANVFPPNVILRDIGRDWMEAHHYKKSNLDNKFTHWMKV